MLLPLVVPFEWLAQHRLRTPRWLGILVQRPEAHVLHHQRELTELNYGDSPLWDIIFGTFRNPAQFSGAAVGFGGGADERYGAGSEQGAT